MTATPEETPVRCVCGRLLRDDESRRLRLGPVCRKRLSGRPARRRTVAGTPTAGAHPRAVLSRPGQLEFAWDDTPDARPEHHRTITDVPTGALL